MSGTVVFQHGLGGGEDQVAQNWPDDTGFQRVTYACRGHDQTPLGQDRPFTIPLFAGDVLRAAATDRFVVGGISMGAAISLYLACHHPERIKALILIRPAWTFLPAPANMVPIAEMAALLLRMSPEAAAAAFRSSDTGLRLAKDSPDSFASLLGYASRDRAGDFAQVLRDIATCDPGVTEAQVAALRLPCLIIGTEIDDIHPLSSAEVLARTIPDARLVRATPKSRSRDLHQSEVRGAISAFLAEKPWRTS